MTGADAAAPNGPVLRVRLGPGQAGPAQDEDRATTLLLAGMTRPQLVALAAGLEDLADRLAVRRNPFVEDLADEPLDRVVRGWSRDHLPALTAARALVQPAWVTGDRTLSATIADRCDGPDSTGREPSRGGESRCIALRGTGDSVDERARFAAWPVTRAFVLRAPAADDAVGATEALREAAAGSSRIALVLVDADARRADRAEEVRVRTAARNVCAGLGRPADRGSGSLCALGHERPAGRLFANLDLTARDVLVLPKLSSLAEQAAFEDEVDRVAAAAYGKRE
ncbi:MAG TPA: hypothetical protein VKU41_15560 [Polyangiaceae bacterium]|nr:hypothetical protein [Polyangiaceae bacterium]